MYRRRWDKERERRDGCLFREGRWKSSGPRVIQRVFVEWRNRDSFEFKMPLSLSLSLPVNVFSLFPGRTLKGPTTYLPVAATGKRRDRDGERERERERESGS